ncbi:MAG: RNA polymerase sigma factor [Balneolales bacterium]
MAKLQSSDLNYREVSDPQVWSALKRNDKDALKILFERYYSNLYQYAVKFCGCPDMAEDHIQNLFLKIWENRKTLGEVTGVKTYLWTALRRSLITALMKNKRKDSYKEEITENLSEMDLNAEEIITREELDDQRKKELKDALDQLTNKQREVLFLKFYEGMSYEEIEQIMSVSSQTSRNYVYEGLKSLKNILSVDNANTVYQQKEASSRRYQNKAHIG